MKRSIAQRKARAAFTLVEVALALGIASFCLVAVMGLVPLGVDTGQMASDQAAASSILTHVLTDLRATPMASPPGSASTVSREYGLTIPDNTAHSASNPPAILYFGDSAQQFTFPAPGSTPSPVAGAASRYRLTVTYLPSVGGRAATGVNLLVSWPAKVDPAKPSTGTPTGRVQIFAALDRN